MHTGISIREVESGPLAAARVTTELSTWPREFMRTLDKVYGAVKAGHVRKNGKNVMVYYPRPDGRVDIACGVEIGEPFEPVGEVVACETPSGLAVTTTHIGPYRELSASHAALVEWMHKNGHHSTGICWEVYGHWTDDVTQLRTDLFHLVRS